MISLNTYIEEANIKEAISNKITSELKKALLIWSASGISSTLRMFEESKYSFNNCDKVVDDVLDIVNNITKNETINLDCEKYKTFFSKLTIDVRIANKIEGYHEKGKNDTKHVKFGLTILDKPIEEYTLKEQRKLKYMIIHELTHAYENYLMIQSGNLDGIFYDVDSKEYKKYYNSVSWLLTNRKLPKIKEELILCGYFLDDHEKFAYLGTVKETVKNLFHKLHPTYKDLKFDEIIDLFKEEFVWDKYLQINVFINTLIQQKSDKKLRYKICKLYNSTYDDDCTEDEIINELIDKWEKFKKEFVKEFVDTYASCESTIKLESYIDMQL